MRREPVLGDRGEVRRGAVPDVARPGICRVSLGERVHEPVARDLRDDRRARDRVAPGVAPDDGRVHAAEQADRLAVDEHVVRGVAEAGGHPGQGTPHRQRRGVVDVQPVDLARALAAPTPTASARARMRPARRTRTSGASRFESSTPAMARRPGGMTTAHATTGPASGPRPTSSTPATSGPCAVRTARSIHSIASATDRSQRRRDAAADDLSSARRRRRAVGRDDLALADAGGLAGDVAQVVQLRAAHEATAHDGDVGEHGAVDREDALDADAVARSCGR